MAQPSLLGIRNFRLLLIGQTTSQLGAQVSGVAIPLLAVLTLEASAFEVGLVAASSTLAFALIGLPAGAWLDRVHRRPVLIASDWIRAILMLSIPAAAVLGVLSIFQLVIVSLLSGFARVFFDVGYQSYIPSVIGKNRVLAGNSAMETIRASGQVVGPGLGGWLVGLIGAAAVLLVQAFTFVVSAVSLMAIRSPEPEIERSPERPNLWRQIRDGLFFVLNNRILRSVAIASAAGNFAFALASAVTFIFMSRELGLTPAAIGIMIALGSLAALGGAALTPLLSRIFGSARIIWLSLVATGPFALLTPLAQPGWWVLLLLAGLAVGELGQIVYAVSNVSLRQQLCPDHLLGRVNATMRFLIMGAFPLGALLGGLLGDAAGTRAALFAAGFIIAGSGLPLFFSLRGVREVAELSSWDPAPRQ
ncbi:MFS transporter [Arthrobacter sp. JZ12]|uniref:MFS transporter n=1 Tax=Arthrobacter sp. JZ12 TaxID=2654190 RepID=UPI002B49C324|nr:MFS transporter [Arthrobacter sp. JZ12]WRH23675.1 MFS transporter [Arthrobacter sp. JZ12]